MIRPCKCTASQFVDTSKSSCKYTVQYASVLHAVHKNGVRGGVLYNRQYASVLPVVHPGLGGVYAHQPVRKRPACCPYTALSGAPVYNFKPRICPLKALY